MKYKKVIVLLGVLGVTVLTGCSNSELAQLNSMPSLNSEAATNEDYGLTMGEKQSMIYAQVSERQLLDLSLLADCSEEEIQAVKTYMNNVDAQLRGQVSSEDGVINVCFTDYLLSEFQKTPYNWQRTKTIIRGTDSASGNIVVDVTYNTIDAPKEVIKDSFIVEGEPYYDKKSATRLELWNSILEAWDSRDPNYTVLLDQFTKTYGDPKEIFESQRNLGLTEQVFETGNQRTYNGCIDSTLDKEGAEMTVRYVLVPNFVLGINLGLDCKHMYITDYQVNNDTTTDMTLFKEDGYATITDNVTALMHSYFTCIDENDMNGLYKLTKNFQTLDKHYRDMFDTTYTKHNSFSVSLFSIEGTNITAGIEIASKVRAKGSEMTMPVYTDRYLVNIELVDEQLQVTNLTLLSRVLEGEPVIDTNEVEDEGFSAVIDLSNQDKKDIEQLICNFSAIQLQEDTTSDKFSDIVDISASDEKLVNVRQNMTSLGGIKKVVYLQTYQQGTSNYASVKCRELYQKDDNSIVEAIVNYEFISKGDKWYIYDYNIVSSVALDTTNLSTSNSLCYVTPGKVEQYTSQIVSIKETSDSDKDDVTSGVSIEHEVNAPILKDGSEEEGLVLKTYEDITEDEVNEAFKTYTNDGDVIYTILDVVTADSALGIVDKESLEYMVKSAVAVRYNLDNNRYKDDFEKQEVIDGLKEELDTNSNIWKEKIASSDELKEYQNLLNAVKAVVNNEVK